MSGYNYDRRISTHALREEGDIFPSGRSNLNKVFLPTPSARRATPQAANIPKPQPISTHALREEGDRSRYCVTKPGFGFLPTPSARRATTGTLIF